MIVTQYICDKCGDVQNNPDQFWTVGIWFTNPTYGHHTKSWGKSMNMCRKCIEDAGLGLMVTERDPDQMPPTPTPTMEDIIHDIVETAVEGMR